MLCEYGCGKEGKHQFKNGKMCCSKDWRFCSAIRKKISESLNKSEVKNRRSKSMEDVWKNNKYREKVLESRNRLEVKEKHRKAIIEVLNKPEVKGRLSKIQIEVQNRLEVRKKHSETMQETWRDPEKNKKLLEIQNIPGIKKRNSEAHIDLWKNKSDEEKEDHLSKIFRSNKKKPNKTELFVNNLIQCVRPNEFKYVGDGQVWISGKCPDWININGKKQVIEYFSNYWHKKEDEESRKEHFKKHGFDCLIIWEEELQNVNSLRNEILSF